MGSRKIFLGLIMCIMLCKVAFTQDAKIQSGIVYYFTNYVEWPASKSSGDFVIGIVGSGGVTDFLQQLARVKKVGTRKIVIKKISTVSTAKGCHIIFLTKKKSAEFDAAIVLAISTKSLLVTESEGFGEKGAGINFVTKKGKTAFEINESAINSCGLKVSSKLKALGIIL
jgi:hypothetical protein